MLQLKSSKTEESTTLKTDLYVQIERYSNLLSIVSKCFKHVDICFPLFAIGMSTLPNVNSTPEAGSFCSGDLCHHDG